MDHKNLFFFLSQMSAQTIKILKYGLSTIHSSHVDLAVINPQMTSEPSWRQFNNSFGRGF